MLDTFHNLTDHLNTQSSKCESQSESAFFMYLVNSVQEQPHINPVDFLSGLMCQVRYSKDRRFKADFCVTLPSKQPIYIEWEGMNQAKSAYRSHSGYTKHMEKYNWLTAHGFKVIRMCEQLKPTFWELFTLLTIK